MDYIITSHNKLLIHQDTITASDVDKIDGELQSHPNIDELYLTCKINTDNIQKIITTIQLIPKLSSLELFHCKWESPKLCKMVFDALQSSCPIFISLDLIATNIGDEGAMYLASYLRSNSSLSSLYLGDPTITTTGMDAITKSLLSHSTLRNLELRCNGKIGMESARDIINVLHSLQRLSVNGIKGGALDKLAKALATNTSIVDLNFGI